MKKYLAPFFIAFTAALLVSSCGVLSSQKPLMFFNITSDVMQDPHSATMALQLANHALDDGREVVLFFNVKGVVIPTKDFDGSLSFKDKPVKDLLAGVVEKGARVHVCPHCMKALGVKKEDLAENAVVTDREKLFSELTSNTVVFTY